MTACMCGAACVCLKQMYWQSVTFNKVLITFSNGLTRAPLYLALQEIRVNLAGVVAGTNGES